jgi:hypothetical protein
MTTVTESPSSLPISVPTADLIGSLWVRSPNAINELANGNPSTVPSILTNPRVPKNSAYPTIFTYVQPTGFVLFNGTATKVCGNTGVSIEFGRCLGVEAESGDWGCRRHLWRRRHERTEFGHDGFERWRLAVLLHCFGA